MVGVAMTGGNLVNQAGGTISAGQTNGVYGTAIALTGSNNALSLLAGSTINGDGDIDAVTVTGAGTLALGATYLGTAGDHQFDHGGRVTFGIQF